MPLPSSAANPPPTLFSRQTPGSLLPFPTPTWFAALQPIPQGIALCVLYAVTFAAKPLH